MSEHYSRSECGRTVDARKWLLRLVMRHDDHQTVHIAAVGDVYILLYQYLRLFVLRGGSNMSNFLSIRFEVICNNLFLLGI